MSEARKLSLWLCLMLGLGLCWARADWVTDGSRYGEWTWPTGTATNSLRLEGIPAAGFVQTNTTAYATAAQGGYADGWHSVSGTVVSGAAAGATADQPGHTQAASSITGVTYALYFTLVQPLVYDAEGSNLEFEVQWSTNADFSNATLYCTTNSQTGWDYFNGSRFNAFPAGGLSSNYYGTNVAGACVVFAPTNGLERPVYLRARAWDGADWGDYFVGYGYGAVKLGN